MYQNVKCTSRAIVSLIKPIDDLVALAVMIA